MMTRRARAAAVPAPLIAALGLIASIALTACGSSAQGTSTGRLPVVASFYPLQFAAEQIGGGHLAVKSLTKPGAEPHDIELTTQDVASVSEARLVIYEQGLQGAVDKAVETQAGDHSLNVAPAAKLDLRFQPTVGAAAESSGENAPGSTDPHFWLDPQRYSDVAKAIATKLASTDPAHKADYQQNAKAFEGKLTALSQEFTTGLASCKRRDIVTSHAAFGYLAERFDMQQIAINGLSPHEEPNAAKLGAISTYAKAHQVTTIYAETLASPAIAQTVAKEAGARLATLDPIEGLTSQSRGKDYFEVMRSNLKALQSGQGCT
ncbi:MAG: zinc transport system substrate-binding protein [Actinomycetota bacterium]|jgi:zinc transport system substrate-binding protein|nr:zinc transport system substrate-binding protein [Actinomycetota bacterium]